MLNKKLTGPQAFLAFLAILCSMAFFSALFNDAPTPEKPSHRDIAREQYKERRQAQRRVQARQLEAGVEAYCRGVGPKTEACRDMRLAAGLE